MWSIAHRLSTSAYRIYCEDRRKNRFSFWSRFVSWWSCRFHLCIWNRNRGVGGMWASISVRLRPYWIGQRLIALFYSTELQWRIVASHRVSLTTQWVFVLSIINMKMWTCVCLNSRLDSTFWTHTTYSMYKEITKWRSNPFEHTINMLHIKDRHRVILMSVAYVHFTLLQFCLMLSDVLQYAW